MSEDALIPAATHGDETTNEVHHVFVTMTIDSQLFGIPVLLVQDVLGPQHINNIPLAPPEVAGSLNLRGRVVTAIDVRKRLGLAPRAEDDPGMSVVVEHGNELYSLIIDSVGEVLSLPASASEGIPATLDSLWQSITSGIYQLDDQLMVELDIDRVLDFADAETEAAAA